ncbi:MAG TPA: hypothetical protein VGM23_17905 [Armatimonadota bacterium]|jgi:hypothetical protein
MRTTLTIIGLLVLGGLLSARPAGATADNDAQVNCCCPQPYISVQIDRPSLTMTITGEMQERQDPDLVAATSTVHILASVPFRLSCVKTIPLRGTGGLTVTATTELLLNGSTTRTHTNSSSRYCNLDAGLYGYGGSTPSVVVGALVNIRDTLLFPAGAYTGTIVLQVTPRD